MPAIPTIAAPTVSASQKRKYSVTLADLQAAGAVTTQDFVLDTFPAGAVLLASRIKHSVAVAGAGTAVARLNFTTQAATPIVTQLGAGTLNVATAVNSANVLDGTNSVTGVTPAAGDTESTTQLIMTVTTGSNMNLATAGQIDASAEVIYVGL